MPIQPIRTSLQERAFGITRTTWVNNALILTTHTKEVQENPDVNGLAPVTPTPKASKHMQGTICLSPILGKRWICINIV